MKQNLWVWTELTEQKMPDRKAGDAVPKEYLTEGSNEYCPPSSWIKKGYVERIQMQQTNIYDYLGGR